MKDDISIDQNEKYKKKDSIIGGQFMGQLGYHQFNPINRVKFFE